MATMKCEEQDVTSVKRLKSDDDVKDNGANNQDEKKSDAECIKTIHDCQNIQLSMLSFNRLLTENSQTKTVVFEAEYENEKAVIVLEKTPFSEENVLKLINDKSDQLEKNFSNDIYGTYSARVSASLNPIKTTIIHPATEKHLIKYKQQETYLMKETKEVYESLTLPHIKQEQLALNWVYNILQHKSESERIVFEDEDLTNGFILLPDMKWNQKQKNDLYLVAICHRRDIQSLRDLNEDKLPLLINIKEKSCKAIRERYGMEEKQLRIYVHYQPSYYHFHVHFTAVGFDAPGCRVERAHLLDTIINNIEMKSDYYQNATLHFPIIKQNSLYPIFVNANLI